MQYPDTNPPAIISFNPISGSHIKFNATEKYINFSITEPSECRWDSEERYDFDKMSNNFACDEMINSNPINGYRCSGVIRNITLNMSLQTKIFIKCKDQPWIENSSIVINGVTYSRNEMERAEEYVLRPSEELVITEISPSNIKVSSSNLSIRLSAITSGGSANGRATCEWKITNLSSENSDGAGFLPFYRNENSLSTQIITSPYSENFVEVKCKDIADNEARKNSTLSIVVDSQGPQITRAYKNAGNLVIKTDEESLCYYSFNKNLACSFSTDNATLFSGLYSTIHETGWVDDKNYYIICEDYFKNSNAGCGKIIRTY
jgi:hypothetical protein